MEMSLVLLLVNIVVHNSKSIYDKLSLKGSEDIEKTDQ